jgi:predicted RNA-binding Zn-ribbon protein involved in translation (DUF1610 family)
VTTTVSTRVICPGCGDALEPGYITNAVVLDGEVVKVCDRCQQDDYLQCDHCRKHKHKSECRILWRSWTDDEVICEDCAVRIDRDFKYAVERKIDELRLEGLYRCL